MLWHMVFCRECKRKVGDCEHFVAPLEVSHVPVFDPKVKTLAYNKHARILEVAFKNGQVWQLAGIPPAVYDELLHATLSSFLKILAHRYKASPVRTAVSVRIPESEPCPACKRAMTVTHQTMGKPTRVLWHCERCNQSLWLTYSSESVRDRKTRWH
jgi:hypothetical protein